MSEEAALPASGSSLLAALAPTLRDACEERLSEVSWFRTDWQRGGAVTGTATFAEDGADAPIDVVVKMPVSGRELEWHQRLAEPWDGDADAATGPVVPRLLASGAELGQYDLAWLVMERVPHGPLGMSWHEDHVERVARALARFQAGCARFEADEAPRLEDWPTLLRDAQAKLKENGLDDTPRWRKALKAVLKSVDGLVETWRDRDTHGWIHGDAHLANAMSREHVDHGPVTLIDLAEVRVGHWIEDAVFLERQLWARPERMKAAKPVKAVARARKELGLPVEDDWPRLAAIRRVLLGATAPCFLRTEGHPRHLAACLEHVERGLKEA